MLNNNIVNEILPKPTIINLSTTNNTNIITGKTIFTGSIMNKFEKIGANVSTVYLNETHYFIEISSADTTQVVLPLIQNYQTIFYIIRKKFIGTLQIITSASDTIENDPFINISNSDQMIQLTNDSQNTWLII